MIKQLDEDLRGTVQFHGHLCPGLALGYRVAKAALRELAVERPQDEELVAVVENDSCAVDAIQFVTGCTFGKGNLLYRDHGKHVYTFFDRGTGRGVRIYAEFRSPSGPGTTEGERESGAGKGPASPADREAARMERVSAILAADEGDLLVISSAPDPSPERAVIRSSVRCSACGENCMESRARKRDGAVLCIPCFQRR